MDYKERKMSSKRFLCLMAAIITICSVASISGTIAWFTEEVTSAGNIITSGNLKVELYHQDPTDSIPQLVDNQALLFDAITSGKWEPGAVAYENFTVKNTGSLALKYQMDLKVDQESIVGGHRLSEAVQYALVPGGVHADTRAEAIAQGNQAVGGWRALSDAPLSQMTGELEASAADTDVWGVILYWMPTAQDNLFNMKNEKNGFLLDMQVAVKLVATQYTNESDAFGNTYDAAAVFTQALTAKADDDGKFSITNKENTLKVTGEAASIDGSVAVIIDDADPAAAAYLAVADGQTLAAYDIRVEGQKAGSLVKVQLQLEPNLTDVAVFRESTKMQAAGSIPTADTFSYDESTGVITLYVDHFNIFSFIYTRPGRTTGIPATPPPATPADDFIWTKTSEGIIITGYKGNASRVQVPEIIDGAPVIRIGENAFAGNKTLTHISLPESVTSIGKKAFYQCSNLESMSTY